MPAPAPVYLKGGPCDGTHRKLTAAENSSGQLTCKGATYQRPDNPATHDGLYVWDFQKQPADSGAPSVRAPRAHSGWADLQRSFNNHWHPALNKSDKLTRDALRRLGRTHKVGR